MTGGAMTGYHPGRIRVLAARTVASIDDLATIRSNDPAAADALRAVRLLRRNLEDHWMPLIRGIEASDAMLARHAEALRLQAQTEAYLQPSIERLSAMSDDRLFEEFWILGMELAQYGHDPTTWRDLVAGSAVLAERARDPEFATRLIDELADAPILGRAIALAPNRERSDGGFDDELVARIAMSMLQPGIWKSRDTRAIQPSAIEPALVRLRDRPDLALGLLGDREALRTLATRPDLDPAIVADLVVSALSLAPQDDPVRLADGYRVLAQLTVLANGRADAGMAPGMARGAAMSLPTYLDTLALGLDGKMSERVWIIETNDRRGLREGVDLGTFDDVVDLFGSVMRDVDAQAAVGVALGAHVDRVMTMDDRHPEWDPDRDHVGDRIGLVRFADLVSNAIDNESAEMVVNAASAEAQRQQIGSIAGSLVGAAQSAAGVGVVSRALTKGAIAVAVHRWAKVEPGRLSGTDPRAFTSDSITVSVLRRIADDPDTRSGSDLEAVTDEQWTELRRRIDAVDAVGADPYERGREMAGLAAHVAEVPALTAHLRRERSIEGLDRLAQGAPVAVDT